VPGRRISFADGLDLAVIAHQDVANNGSVCPGFMVRFVRYL